MLFGLAGSHRSGKTTLAKMMAEELGLTFYETSTTKVARELGYDPVAPMTLTDRVHLQIGLLTRHIEDLDRMPRPLITDRTPADILAYMLAEFSMQSASQVAPGVLDEVERFKNLAMDALLTRYDTIYVIGQLEGYAAEPGKPPFNRPFQTHHALLVEGIMSHTKDQMRYMRIYTTDLEKRREALHASIVKRLDTIDAYRRSGSHVH